MTEAAPRKKLTLKRKSKLRTTENAENKAIEHEEVKEFVRGRKRVLKMQSAAEKKAIKDSHLSPAERQSRELKRLLAETFSVWRRRRPLAIGIDEQIAEFIAEKKLEISKRAIKKLLHRHTNHKNYLSNVTRGGKRFKLDGTEEGDVGQKEREHARRTLDAADKK